MKFTNKNIFHLFLMFIFSVLIGAGGTIAFDIISDRFSGYRINSGDTKQIADLSYDMGDYGLGYQLTNISGKNHFIPTRSQNE